MLSKKHRFRIYMIILVAIFLVSQIQIVHAGRDEKINGFQKQDHIKPGEDVKYSFNGENYLEIYSNASLEVNLQFNSILENRQISFNFSNSEDTELIIRTDPFSERFQQNKIKQARNQYRNRWGAYIYIHSNVSIDSLEVSVAVTKAQSVKSNSEWAMYHVSDDWIFLDSIQTEEEVNTTLVSTSTDIFLTVFTPTIKYLLNTLN